MVTLHSHSQGYVTHVKEESKARMKIGSIDRDKLRKYLVTSIALFSVDGHPQESPHTFRKALNQRNKSGLVQNCRRKAIAAVYKRSA